MTQYEKQFYETIIRELPKITETLNNIQKVLELQRQRKDIE